jgi:hypothetical protein
MIDHEYRASDHGSKQWPSAPQAVAQHWAFHVGFSHLGVPAVTAGARLPAGA